MQLSALIVVGRHDVLLYHLLDLLTVLVQVARHVVVVYLCLQSLEFSLCIVHIALKLHGLLQFVHLLLAQLVVGESALDDALLEVVVVGIRQVEVLGGSNGGMLGNILRHVVEHHLRRVQTVQIECDIGQRVGLHLDVRLQTFLHIDAATTGQIVARRGQLQVRIIRQVDVGNLHQALPVCARTYYYGALQVLQGTAGNLRGRCRLTIHQHHDGHHRVDRLQTGLVFAVCTLQLAFRLYNLLTLRHPHAHNIDTLRQRTAAIAAQVEDQLLCTLLLQVEECQTHRFRGLARKGVQIDISDAVVQHAVPRNLWHLDVLAGNLKRHLLARRRTLNFQHEGRTGLAAQMTAHVARVLVRHHRIVYLQDDVALLQTHLR